MNTEEIATQLPPVRALIADGEPFFLAGLRHALEQIPQVTVCGEATERRSALAIIQDVKPDLLISGAWLACGSETSALIRHLSRHNPKAATIVFVPAWHEDLSHRFFRAGAHGVLSRHGDFRTILRAILAVTSGGTFIERIPGPGQPRPDSTAGAIETSALSDRELEIFRLLGSSQNCTDIASRLGLSPKTVQAHRENIKRKLGLLEGATFSAVAKAWALWECTGADYLQ